MAKVTIVLEDLPDDSVSFELETKGVPVGVPTVAQIFGSLIEKAGPMIMMSAQLRQEHIKNCEKCKNDIRPATH